MRGIEFWFKQLDRDQNSQLSFSNNDALLYVNDEPANIAFSVCYETAVLVIEKWSTLVSRIPSFHKLNSRLSILSLQ
jgi:hypothetical protein